MGNKAIQPIEEYLLDLCSESNIKYIPALSQDGALIVRSNNRHWGYIVPVTGGFKILSRRKMAVREFPTIIEAQDAISLELNN